MIPVSEPKLFQEEKDLILKCLNTNWISSQGPYVSKFEKNFAKFHNIKYAISVSNCTTALHLALLALGLKRGDEVICPSLTFISPANMIEHVGAKLVLVDVNDKDLNIDHRLIEREITKKTKAIIVVHQFGNPSNMGEILKICKKFKLKLIEDNAEAIGSKFMNRLTGTFGDISTYSFFGNKILTTGEGGMLITNNKRYYQRIKILRDHGLVDKKRYQHKTLGFNYRMTNLQAAIGIGQLKNINTILRNKERVLNCYKKYLNKNSQVYILPLNKDNSILCVNWLVTIYIPLISKIKMTKIINQLNNNGVDIRRMVQPVYKAGHFKKRFNKKKFRISEEFSYKSIHLPSSINLSNSKIKFISHLLLSELKKVL